MTAPQLFSNGEFELPIIPDGDSFRGGDVAWCSGHGGFRVSRGRQGGCCRAGAGCGPAGGVGCPALRDRGVAVIPVFDAVVAVLGDPFGDDLRYDVDPLGVIATLIADIAGGV